MAGYIGSKASVVSSGAERKKTFTITGATTSLTGLNYTVGKVHVFQNGVRLVDGTDYTATNGTTITLTVAAQSGDNVVVISQASFQLSEHYTSAEADAEFVNDPSSVITVSGSNVGIGTSSGANLLNIHQSSASSNSYLHITHVDGGSAATDGLSIGLESDGVNAVIRNRENGYLRMYTNNAERMRIDSSGKVLVGATSSTGIGNGTNEGISISSSQGQIIVGTDSDVSLYLNRQGTDGKIAEFRKNGSAVGSIGTQGSRLSIGSGDVNLNFNASANSMYPISNPTTGALSSGIVDLGAALATFKDAYLSGGVYLGGTGSANKLDSYEEGTFTPSIGFNSNTGGITFQATPQGTYTKVGRKVTVIISFVLTNKGSNSGNFTCSLPFTSIGSGQGSGVMGYNYNWVNGDKARGFTFQVHSGVLYMMNADSGGFATNAEFNNNTYVSGITVTYFTT